MDTPTIAASTSAAAVARPSQGPAKAASQEPIENSAGGAVRGASREPQRSITELATAAAEGKVNSLNTLQSVSASIDEAVQVLNETLSRRHTSAVITRDEQLNRFLVTIKDKESGEVVREIPSEALLKFARNLQELRGILFDETL